MIVSNHVRKNLCKRNFEFAKISGGIKTFLPSWPLCGEINYNESFNLVFHSLKLMHCSIAFSLCDSQKPVKFEMFAFTFADCQSSIRGRDLNIPIETFSMPQSFGQMDI